jgi:hypothetical protein
VWGPRALKNVVHCGFVLDAILFIRAGQGKQWKHIILLHLKTLGGLHTLVLDKLRACLAWGPTNRCALGHGLLRPCLNPPREYKKVILGMPSVRMWLRVRLWASLKLERMGKFYSYQIFKSLSIPENMKGLWEPPTMKRALTQSALTTAAPTPIGPRRLATKV